MGVWLADQFTLSTFALFVDHLRLAADGRERDDRLTVEWSIMGAAPTPVRASCGVMTTPTSGLLDPDALDYIVIVGGVLHGSPMIDPAVAHYLHRADRAGVVLIGLCSASVMLCRIGLMTGRRCCVSWAHYQDFIDEFPHHAVVAGQSFLDEGDRITCAGGAGVAELAAHLIDRKRRSWTAP